MSEKQIYTGELVVLQQYSSYALPSIGVLHRDGGHPLRVLSAAEEEPSGFLSKNQLILQWAKAFVKWLPKYRSFRDKKIYCTAAHIPVMLICRLFGWNMGDYHVYMHNFYLHGLGQKAFIKKILAYLLKNSHLTILTQSDGEINYYRGISDTVNLRFIPFCSDFEPISGEFPPAIELPDAYIFTGGYTNRDYSLILRLAEKLRDENFVIVASSLNELSVPEGLDNVIVLRDLPKNQFESLLAASKMVIVPLKEDVGASGQMLAVSSLRNGKPTVYTDLSVINYFFADGAGIPYEMGDIESLYKSVCGLLENRSLMEETGRKALEVSRRFSLAAQLPLLRDAMGL